MLQLSIAVTVAIRFYVKLKLNFEINMLLELEIIFLNNLMYFNFIQINRDRIIVV